MQSHRDAPNDSYGQLVIKRRDDTKEQERLTLFCLCILTLFCLCIQEIQTQQCCVFMETKADKEEAINRIFLTEDLPGITASIRSSQSQ